MVFLKLFDENNVCYLTIPDRKICVNFKTPEPTVRGFLVGYIKQIVGLIKLCIVDYDMIWKEKIVLSHL